MDVYAVKRQFSSPRASFRLLKPPAFGFWNAWRGVAESESRPGSPWERPRCRCSIADYLCNSCIPSDAVRSRSHIKARHDERDSHQHRTEVLAGSHPPRLALPYARKKGQKLTSFRFLALMDWISIVRARLPFTRTCPISAGLIPIPPKPRTTIHPAVDWIDRGEDTSMGDALPIPSSVRPTSISSGESWV